MNIVKYRNAAGQETKVRVTQTAYWNPQQGAKHLPTVADADRQMAQKGWRRKNRG